MQGNESDSHYPDPSRHPSRSGVQSVDVALKVLQVLVSAGKPLNLKEFSARCGMSPSKLHRYLHSFAAAGMVTQTHRAGEYDLGKLALEIGLAAIQRIDLVNNTADRLYALVAETGTPASLSVWSDHGPTIIRWQRGSEPINTAFSIGSLLPLLNSATGNVFLTHLPLSVTASVLATEATNIPAAERNRTIDDTINRVRRQGYAISRGGFLPGIIGISAPIFDRQNEAIAAVTIFTRTEKGSATEQALIDSLLAFTVSCSMPRPTGENT